MHGWNVVWDIQNFASVDWFYTDGPKVVAEIRFLMTFNYRATKSSRFIMRDIIAQDFLIDWVNLEKVGPHYTHPEFMEIGPNRQCSILRTDLL